MLFKYEKNWPAAEVIATFEEGDPDENPWVHGKPKPEHIDVRDYDPQWHNWFEKLKADIAGALSEQALAIEHVGSTAVPDLPAKPVIDIDLIVENPDDEAQYVPALEQLGYQLTVRERSWYQHRMLRLNEPRVNLHVFAPNCPEHIRHILFRDWLITHNADRELYGQAKLSAKEGVDNVQAYNMKKQAVVREIYDRLFETYRLYQVNRI
ncbi:GrpB family protein [Paenochrobactrum pullorum]|uniref:GrpB family protein n=1 Tax=Paenochrobactrum pullorum TaxID=1324351 RepID=UPI0035BC5C33